MWNILLNLSDTISQLVSITSSRENRNITRVALMDYAGTSQAFSPEMGSSAKQQLSARTFQPYLQRHGQSSWRR